MSHYRPSRSEPVFWSLFGAGGVVAAFFAPVLIFLVGLALPLRWISVDAFAHSRVASLMAQPLVRLFVFVVVALPLWHWAHRFRFALFDLGLKRARGLVAVLCYGCAAAGTLLAILVLLKFG